MNNRKVIHSDDENSDSSENEKKNESQFHG